MRWSSDGFSTCIRRLSLAVVTFAMTGCAPWTAIPAPAPADLPRATELQLWLGRQAMVLREVTVETDSIHGRRVEAVRRPTGTRVVVARVNVDSVRIRAHDPQNWFGAGILAGALGGIVVTAAVFRGALAD